VLCLKSTSLPDFCSFPCCGASSRDLLWLSLLLLSLLLLTTAEEEEAEAAFASATAFEIMELFDDNDVVPAASLPRPEVKEE